MSADETRLRKFYEDAAFAAAYALQGLLDHDDRWTREIAATANARVIAAREAWVATLHEVLP